MNKLKRNNFIPILKDNMDIFATLTLNIGSNDCEEEGNSQPSPEEIKGLKNIALHYFLGDLDHHTFHEFWKSPWSCHKDILTKEDIWTKDAPIIHVKEGNVKYDPKEQVIVLKAIFNVSSIVCKKTFVDTLQYIIHINNEKSIYQVNAGNFNLVRITLMDASHEGTDILNA